MGSFSDAFDEGQKAHQTQQEQDQKRKAAELQAATDRTAAAKAWADNQLIPVVEEARRDLVGKGSVVVREARPGASSNLLSAHEIHIEMTGKRPCKLSFHVRDDGAITAYKNNSSGNTIGSITNIGQVQIKQLLVQALREIGGQAPITT